MSATIVKKIATKTVLGGPTNIRKMEDGPIMRIMGIMRGTQTGEGDNGPWTAFIGNFQAVNLTTGEIFVAAKAFLPGAAGEMIEQAWNAAQEGENPAENLKFAFDIKKLTDDTSAVGYIYTAVPLVEAKEDDPLAALASTLPPLPQLALPAPQPEPEKTGNKK